VSSAFESARLDEIERDPTRPEWIPIRRRFGITAFGVNAWSAAGPEDDLIPEYEESSIGHEELNVVVAGQARFTVGGEEIEAPAGTICSSATLPCSAEPARRIARAAREDDDP
jgi:hypothetical protein